MWAKLMPDIDMHPCIISPFVAVLQAHFLCDDEFIERTA